MYLFQESNSAWERQETNTNFLPEKAQKGTCGSLRHEWKDNIDGILRKYNIRM
jgi:hypothetical protein